MKQKELGRETSRTKNAEKVGGVTVEQNCSYMLCLPVFD